jgi:uncharacterized protein (DUF1800 family)
MKILQHAKRRKRRRRLHRPANVGITSKILTDQMVERLFWRAGFGPTTADRQRWKGKKVDALAEWFLSTSPTMAGPPPSRDGKPLDPTTEDVDLVLEWVDRMVRTTNPFVERLTFFFHRHFANGRDGGPSAQMLMRQMALFRSYADFAKRPAASFRDLVREVTVDPSMLRYLTGEDNVAGHSNENYAREVMELFCLGVVDERGRKTYDENDVKHLARAFTGWQIDESDPDRPVSRFSRSRWSNGLKQPFGLSNNYQAYAVGDPQYQPERDAVEIVLARPPRRGDRADVGRKPYETHARFFLRKLWHEFIVSEPDEPTLRKLVAAYLTPAGGRPGLRLKPVLKLILTHPLIFESIDEPNMVKPPVVYVVGLMRAFGARVRDDLAHNALNEMGQLPYNPPNVSGWEGGSSWLNTNTVISRFAFAGQLMADPAVAPRDRSGETAPAAVARALAEIGRPWIAKGTRAVIDDYASRAPSGLPNHRVQRQKMIRALAAAGPDHQVM